MRVRHNMTSRENWKVVRGYVDDMVGLSEELVLVMTGLEYDHVCA